MINVYVDDKTNNLLAIPTGRIEGLGIVDIELMEVIEFPFDEVTLLRQIEKTLSLCFSKVPPLPSKESAIANLLGKKNYSAATKGKKLVVLTWEQEHGYKIYPTAKDRRGGYTHLFDSVIVIGDLLAAELLFSGINNAIQLSTK
ncbi:hypothetical protein K0T92_24385 [Paenibacillus oenotherae]|uniref:Uncharacterized protein n=1 Tax=Paenibacillus oenotherae TaxID=1435645 RepID=A0ABS7DEE4_9BACL|nr:hypothetical protein [Paenibacillus oenotherae]MBW7477852.1 hypothetical protein [Paenibacillus oenotherae]